MRPAEEILSRILDWLEEQVDLAHREQVAKRHRDVLYWRAVDRPPVSLVCPASGRFPAFPYAEGFDDPVKMMVNELVRPSVHPCQCVVRSAETGDDFPWQIRSNHGVIIIASLFGAQTWLLGDNMPWVRPIGEEGVRQALDQGIPDLHGGVADKVFATMALYQQKLAEYPKCRQAIHITQPDLQGVMDILHLLWGGDLFVHLYDDPALIHEAMDLIAQTYIAFLQEVQQYTTDQVGEGCIYLHWAIMRGNFLLKNDTPVMVSAQMYEEFIRPHDEQIMQACGGGGIHFCSSADHCRDQLVATEGLTGIDFGQPELNDLDAWYQALGEKNAAIMNLLYPGQDIANGAYRRRFPTGVSFATTVDDIRQGQELMAAVNARV